MIGNDGKRMNKNHGVKGSLRQGACGTTRRATLTRDSVEVDGKEKVSDRGYVSKAFSERLMMHNV
ncbi:hypothetical protein D1B31_23805 [Neobacillus notoginsengisoli]|uniref:Uncharacterized protein n=1 Tax=Neobacillus notoginsengisoli TaxID=1578198 RepID=A0A417YCD7_9BACI|nr:hypothetical protein D1B31_23805 [Neobacillus notoginsengisoli]